MPQLACVQRYHLTQSYQLITGQATDHGYSLADYWLFNHWC
jgi:hypothetical protein